MHSLVWCTHIYWYTWIHWCGVHEFIGKHTFIGVTRKLWLTILDNYPIDSNLIRMKFLSHNILTSHTCIWISVLTGMTIPNTLPRSFLWRRLWEMFHSRFRKLSWVGFCFGRPWMTYFTTPLKIGFTVLVSIYPRGWTKGVTVGWRKSGTIVPV
jgi:hypothetical protein